MTIQQINVLFRLHILQWLSIRVDTRTHLLSTMLFTIILLTQLSIGVWQSFITTFCCSIFIVRTKSLWKVFIVINYFLYRFLLLRFVSHNLVLLLKHLSIQHMNHHLGHQSILTILHITLIQHLFQSLSSLLIVDPATNIPIIMMNYSRCLSTCNSTIFPFYSKK